MAFTVKSGDRTVQQPPAFHKNVIRTVDHDFRNGRIAQQRRERTQPDQIIQQNLLKLIQLDCERYFMPDFSEYLINRISLEEKLPIFRISSTRFCTRFANWIIVSL